MNELIVGEAVRLRRRAVRTVAVLALRTGATEHPLDDVLELVLTTPMLCGVPAKCRPVTVK